jgi:hypothetical protein
MEQEHKKKEVHLKYEQSIRTSNYDSKIYMTIRVPVKMYDVINANDATIAAAYALSVEEFVQEGWGLREVEVVEV